MRANRARLNMLPLESLNQSALEPAARLASKVPMPYDAPMADLKITSKGQVTLRKDILQHLGLAPGARVSVAKLDDGRVELRAAPKGDIRAAFNLLKGKTKKPVSLEEIKRLTEAGWSGKR